MSQVASIGLVHHGGFGTTSAGFHAGIPALVIPHIIDQFIWGQKVAELGVEPQHISRAKLKPQAMANALIQMKSPEMRNKAKALGENIHQEDGVNVAVKLIENL
jgi:UDP:flavonoid glycosyltransferase YjiC (YdhE family)